MANAVRAKVELRSKYRDPDKNFKEMHQEFKRRVSNAGIMHAYKDHQFFESKSEKTRKKKKEAIKKARMVRIEQAVMSGEKVNAPSGVIKKIMANAAKKDKRKEK